MGKFLLTLFFLLLLCSSSWSQHLLSKAYTPGFKSGKVRSFIHDIGKKTGVLISFSEAVVNLKQKVVLAGDEQTVGEVLKKVLQYQQVTLKESGDKILIIPSEQPNASAAAPPYDITLSGFIKDSSSKEVLIGASLYIPELGTGTMANTFGFYSLTLPSGNYTMLVSYVGYSTRALPVKAGSSIRRDILLAPQADMQEINITEKTEQPKDHINFKPKDILYYTSLLGDNDVLKALQRLPGVQSAADGTANLIVRGGDPGQNLNLLDGVPLYYTDHFYGISSIYNTDALKTADFYSGSFPSRYGGRLSSITDVNTKDGNMEQWGGIAKVGLLNGSLSLEGPLIKDKASVIVTARRSWMDLIWRPFDNTIGVNFYDANAKINYVINSNNRIYLSVYNGQDRFRVGDSFTDMRASWGNTFLALKWNTILSPKVFINTTATYSTFRYELKDAVYGASYDSTGQIQSYKGVSSVVEKTINSQLYWYLNPQHKIEAGIKYANALFSPATVRFSDGSLGSFSIVNPAREFHSNEALLYAEDEWRLSPGWKIRAGLHWTNWFSNNFSYSSLQPRLYVSYTPKAHITLYASATRMAQFLHLLSNNTSGFPTDFWLPSTVNIKPETSTLGNIGIRIKAPRDLDISVEAYYKQQQGLVTYRGGRTIFDDAQQWEDKLAQGKGWSYGTEVALRKTADKFTASLAYTLSWSFRQYDRLNYGETFPYRYDRRHNLRLDGVYNLKKGIEICVGWTYMSGEAITLPDQAYPDFDNNTLNNYVNYGYTYNYTNWNNYRLPAIHRLDLAVNFTRKRKEKYERTITVGVYNAYGRKNLVGSSLNTEDPNTYQLIGYSIARFIPTISYRLQF